ncbi:hypothetical protein [Nonomuraea sp. GTA35]|uniref:hypothetical protein n=1 Tax=Nonomuraea sp. GTA35 TaxID=1676746 RepID=UPI0035C0C104
MESLPGRTSTPASIRVACVIPWRGGHEDRERHHETVRAHLRDLLPDAWHIDSDSGHEPFSRAGSRNRGVRLAEDVGADVVVLCDADTLPERGPLLLAIEKAQDGRLHLPYTRFRGFTQPGTVAYLKGVDPEWCEVDVETDWSVGGVLVIQPGAWWRAGGMDERCVGYGYEDEAFKYAADTLLGPTARHTGTIWHLWHEQQMGVGSPEHTANGQFAARYKAAYGHPEAMRALLAEHAQLAGRP